METEQKNVETSAKKPSPFVPVAGLVLLVALGLLAYFFGGTKPTEQVQENGTETVDGSTNEVTEGETTSLPAGTETTAPKPTAPKKDVDMTYAIVSESKIDNLGRYHTIFLVNLSFVTAEGLTGSLDLSPKIACKQTNREEEVLDETRSARNFTYNCISDAPITLDGTVWFAFNEKEI